MKRLISSFATALFLFLPTTVQAQHQFGGGFYQRHVQQQVSPDYLELQFRDGRIVVVSVQSGTRHEDVAAQYGIAYCEQNWRQMVPPPPGFGHAAVITQGFCRNQQQPNHYNRNFNPGYRYHQPRHGGGGGGLCIKTKNRDGSFFQLGNC